MYDGPVPMWDALWRKDIGVLNPPQKAYIASANDPKSDAQMAPLSSSNRTTIIFCAATHA